jgi:hypothetical protein
MSRAAICAGADDTVNFDNARRNPCCMALRPRGHSILGIGREPALRSDDAKSQFSGKKRTYFGLMTLLPVS